MGRVKLLLETRQEMIKELNKDLNPFQVNGEHDTICNHLRMLYKTELNQTQKELCEEIIYMAKRMDKKLQEYGIRYGSLKKGNND
jgi:glycine/serine hydroxymethyltransferase